MTSTLSQRRSRGSRRFRLIAFVAWIAAFAALVVAVAAIIGAQPGREDAPPLIRLGRELIPNNANARPVATTWSWPTGPTRHW